MVGGVVGKPFEQETGNKAPSPEAAEPATKQGTKATSAKPQAGSSAPPPFQLQRQLTLASDGGASTDCASASSTAGVPTLSRQLTLASDGEPNAALTPGDSFSDVRKLFKSPSSSSISYAVSQPELAPLPPTKPTAPTPLLRANSLVGEDDAAQAGPESLLEGEELERFSWKEGADEGEGPSDAAATAAVAPSVAKSETPDVDEPVLTVPDLLEGTSTNKRLAPSPAAPFRTSHGSASAVVDQVVEAPIKMQRLDSWQEDLTGTTSWRP